MRCSDIMEKLEELSPASYAENWDNVGLLAGRRDKEVHSVLIALDATTAVVEQAIRMKADLLLTHHPLLFSPQKKICQEDFIGRRLLSLIRNDINYYAMHTNFDVMGMADAAADELGLKNRGVLYVTYEDEISREGLGRSGKLPRIMSLRDCAEYVKKVFGLDQVAVYGDLSGEVEKMAVLPGAGKDETAFALSAGADVYLTGDLSHHAGIDAMEQGLCVIDAGHFGLEKIFMPYMKEFFEREFPQLEVIIAEEKAPFTVI